MNPTVNIQSELITWAIARAGYDLRDTILTLQKRQDWLRSYLDQNGYEKLGFVGKYSIQTPVSAIVTDIREKLGLAEDWAGHLPNWQSALDHLTAKVEEAGIIVVFNGVLDNNTHRPIPVEECRGFVLSDAYELTGLKGKTFESAIHEWKI